MSLSRPCSRTWSQLLACVIGLSVANACDGPDARCVVVMGQAITGAVPVHASLEADVSAVVGLRVHPTGTVGKRPWTCTGTHVGRGRVVTAAHCLHATNGASLSIDVYRGSDMGLDDRCVVGDVEHWTGQVFRHPTLDVAIFDVPALASSPELPRATEPPAVDSRGWIVGYGFDEQKEEGIRRVVPTRIAKAENTIEVDSGPAAGTCHGDSGGPLLVERDGSWFVAGVLSAGSPSCTGSDDFVSISAAAAWIEAR